MAFHQNLMRTSGLAVIFCFFACIRLASSAVAAGGRGVQQSVRHAGKHALDGERSHRTAGALIRSEAVAVEQQHPRRRGDGDDDEVPAGLAEAPKDGLDSCKCISVDAGARSTADGVTVTLKNGTDGVMADFTYASDLVSGQCKAWDAGLYPGACDGASQEAWCAKTWCYVDPCACDTTRKISTYFGSDVTAGGNPLHFSYATCGEDDTYSGNETCGTKTKAKPCGELENCKWEKWDLFPNGVCQDDSVTCATAAENGQEAEEKVEEKPKGAGAGKKKGAGAGAGNAGAGAGAGDVQDVGKGLENADAEKCPADCSDNFDPEDEEGKARCDKLNEAKGHAGWFYFMWAFPYMDGCDVLSERLDQMNCEKKVMDLCSYEQTQKEIYDEVQKAMDDKENVCDPKCLESFEADGDITCESIHKNLAEKAKGGPAFNYLQSKVVTKLDGCDTACVHLEILGKKCASEEVDEACVKALKTQKVCIDVPPAGDTFKKRFDIDECKLNPYMVPPEELKCPEVAAGGEDAEDAEAGNEMAGNESSNATKKATKPKKKEEKKPEELKTTHLLIIIVIILLLGGGGAAGGGGGKAAPEQEPVYERRRRQAVERGEDPDEYDQRRQAQIDNGEDPDNAPSPPPEAGDDEEEAPPEEAEDEEEAPPPEEEEEAPPPEEEEEAPEEEAA